MSFSPLIRQLIDSLRTLPGVGQKSAQRMALQLLERDRSGGSRLAQALSQAMEGVGHCRQCRTLTEEELCPQCADPRRDDTLLCVVEGPMDVYAVEQTGYRGRYFVLKGHLSPLVLTYNHHNLPSNHHPFEHPATPRCPFPIATCSRNTPQCPKT